MGWIVFQRGDRRTQVLGRQETQMGGGLLTGRGEGRNRKGEKGRTTNIFEKAIQNHLFCKITFKMHLNTCV